MRKQELINQSKLCKINNKISNLFNEKYGLKLGEFSNTSRPERFIYISVVFYDILGIFSVRSVLNGAFRTNNFKPQYTVMECKILIRFKIFCIVNSFDKNFNKQN